jgi:PHP family Zn ribbon phosphoesterase
MSPQKITARASSVNIGIVAICDHNTAENVAAVMKAAGGRGVVVLPGMEVCTREEIHVLAIFDTLAPASALQSMVYDHLPGTNDPEAFGMQVVADENDRVVAFQDRLLIGAVELPVEQIVNEIHRLGGIAIASHIDRESYSVVSQLGFIPDTLRFDALELSRHITDQEARDRFAGSSGFTFIRNSDAHSLGDLGENTSEYVLEKPTFQEILKALKGEDGRMVCVP